MIQIVLLLAGKGSRMSDLTDNCNKSMLPVDDRDSFLSRLLQQLNELNIEKLVVVLGYRQDDIKKAFSSFQLPVCFVINDNFDKDTNIYSMKLALDNVNQNTPLLIIEGDIYLDDFSMFKIYNESLRDKTCFFTKGHFNKSQNGGILLEENSVVQNVLIIPKYHFDFKNYLKLIGIMCISSNHILEYTNLINQRCLESFKSYYLFPWVENLFKFKCWNLDLSSNFQESVNTSFDYYELLKKLDTFKNSESIVELVKVNKLKPIESFIKERIPIVEEMISNNNMWTKPLIIESSHNLILDGHHRFEVAKKMNLDKVPVIKVNYKAVDLWSLRPEEIVSRNIVISRSISGNIYPCKTVKHDFKINIPIIKIRLNKLK